MKNRVLLEQYFLPRDPERQISAFVEYYNNQRDHESLGNLTAADVHCGRAERILKQQEEIKRKTTLTRRLRHQTENARHQSAVSQSLQPGKRSSVPNCLTTDTL